MTKAGYLGGTALIMATLLAATTAPADSNERGGKGMGDRGAAMFERLDTNSDGTVTKDEVDAVRAARFAEADADGDGALTTEEMLAFAQARHAEREGRRMTRGVERMLDRLDADNNGSVSLEETAAAPMRMFERLDANEDGAVTKAEMDAAGKHMRDHRGNGRRGEGHRGERHDGEHRGGGRGAPWWMPAE